MISIYNRIPIKYRIRIRSLVQYTGLLVSIWICLMSLILTGCGSEATLYEIGKDADDCQVSEDAPESTEDEAVIIQEESEATEDEQMLVVFLCGAVNNPGVYELKNKSRIIDGINIAGGFREDASLDALNLAMEITDGSRIYVPTIKEADANAEGSTVSVSTDMTDTYITGAGDTGLDSGSKESAGKVNINTADETLLTTLSGIGPSRAKSIIAYREEHGGFGSIEELMNVSGIGQASFDKLKDDITI